MLVCSRCKQEKPLSAFTRNRSVTRGYSYMCKQCLKAYYGEASRKMRIKEKSGEYYKNHKEEYKERYQKNKEKIRNYYKTAGKTNHKYAKIKYKYGITREEYLKLYNDQSGKCAICGKEIEVLGNETHIDHDHDTNIIRGLLCQNCNLGLGYFFDSKEILNKAAEYVDDIR